MYLQNIGTKWEASKDYVNIRNAVHTQLHKNMEQLYSVVRTLNEDMKDS